MDCEIDIYKETLKLLRQHPEPTKQIAAGANVGEFWLARVRQGHFADPGVQKMQRVYRYLVSKQTN